MHIFESKKKKRNRSDVRPFSPAMGHIGGNGSNQWITQARAQGGCWIRNKFRWRWRVRLRIIKSRIINALNTWRRYRMSQNLHQQREAGFWEGGRWRQFYGPTAVTDVTRRSSLRAFCASVRHTWSLRWARCYGLFYGKPGMLQEDQKSSPSSRHAYTRKIKNMNSG